MGINARPSKGIRQPHASICSLLSASVSTMPTTPAASEAMPWLASCQLPYRPAGLGCDLDQIRRRRPDLAAQGQPLHQPTGNDDDGCRQPDACVRG